MIGCASPVSGGELRVLGMNPQTDASRIKARLGVVPQLDNLDAEITVRENLLMYARYFDIPPGGTRLARFMSGVFPVRREWRSRLQAITHVDGSARVQVLEPAMAPRLHALLEAYGQRTGIPVLLNTSFNLAGEPIVNRAVEGYSTFLRCKIDVLVAGETRVRKRTSAVTNAPVDTLKKEVA